MKCTAGNQIEFEVGDEVWYIPPNRPIAIRCKITEVDDQWRKKDPGGILFYDIDEPVGHSLVSNELATSREEAEGWLDDSFELPEIDLIDYRRKTLEFIYSTWEKSGSKPDKTIEEALAEYPVKEDGKDWFKASDI